MAVQYIQTAGANQLVSDIASDRQKRANLDTTQFNLAARKRKEASALQQATGARLLDEAKYKDAQLQGQGPIGSITTIPPQADDGPGVQITAPAQPSVADQRINALQGVAGAGEFAQTIRTGQVTNKKEVEQNIYKLMKEGGKGRPDLIEQAKMLNQKHGVGIPNYFFDDPIILQTLIQAIGIAQKSYKDPQQQNAFIKSYLQSNPDFAKRVAVNEKSGRGLQKGFEAGARQASTMLSEKNKQAMDLQNRKIATAKVRNQWPDRRVKLELIKQYRQLKNDMGESLFKTETELNDAVDRQMKDFDKTPDTAPKPEFNRLGWLEKHFGKK